MAGSSPVVTDDCVYVCSEVPYDEFALHALDIETGEELWRIQYPYVMMSCITLYENALYVPTWEGPLFAFDASNGSILWENSDSEYGYWDSSPMIYDGSVFFLGEGTLRVSAASGIAEWISEIGYGEATLSVHNGVVFSSGYDG